MTKHAYQQSVFSGSDTVAVAPFAQITVTNASDDSAASIWSDAAGANPIADGVLLADENGYFIFYADEGTYNIAILSDGISKTLENVEIGAGNPYSGVFKGSWDMSSGTSGPAAPATDYQATHTGTTITPDAHLTSGQPFPFAAATSALIPILTSGIAQASLIVPSTSPGDTVYETLLLLTNSATTSAIFEQLINSSITPGIWFVGVSISSISGSAQLFVYNNGSSSVGATVPVTAGDVLLLAYDHATGDMTLSVNGTPAGTSTLDVGAIPSGQGLHLMSGVLSNSADVVFAAGSITVNFSDTSGGGTGFSIATDATLPVGALDNDWYEVSAGGYFHGKTTRAGQFVKLIRGKTDLIVVDTPADPGTSSLEAVTVAHFSDINTAGLAEPRLYVVTADETNANQRTQYLYDGAALLWLVALEA